MDVASGVTAFISISIQLVETIKKITSFCKSLQRAPEELLRLIDVLSRLEMILGQASLYLEERSQIEGLPGSALAIQCAIQSCQTNIGKLEKIKDRIESKFDSRGRTGRMWASLNTVITKDEIERVNRLLNDDFSTLQAAILSSMSQIQLVHFRMSSKVLKEMKTYEKVHRENGDVPKDSVVTVQKRAPTPVQSVRTQDHQSVLYNSFAGWIRVRTKTKVAASNHKTSEIAVSEEKTVTIGPSFLQRVFEIEYHGCSGWLPRALRWCPILPITSKVFSWCGSGDIGALKGAFSRQEVSPYARSTNGWSLLHYACNGTQTEIIWLLIGLGVDIEHPGIGNEKASHVFTPHKDTDAERNVAAFLLGSVCEITVLDLAEVMLWSMGSSWYMDMILSSVDPFTDFDPSIMAEYSPLGIAMQNWVRCEDGWELCIRKLLRLGLDTLYLFPSLKNDKKREDYPETLLDCLFWAKLRLDPKAENIGVKEWLSILAEEGRDVQAYLNRELQIHATNDFRLARCSCEEPKPPRKLVFQMGNDPNVWWNIDIDLCSGAGLVRNEFRYMNLDYEVYANEEERWPIVYPSWDRYQPWQGPGYVEWQEWQRKSDLAQARFRRRAGKKYDKENSKPRQIQAMPGAWNETWDG